jgi:tryptophan 2,3-dioxygenase
MIFVTYHQVCELYFSLILLEMEQVAAIQSADTAFFIEKVQRIIRYYENLVFSFDIMLKGLDPAQFAKFRLVLFPSSGFQSVQYRLIEFHATDLHNLVDATHRPELKPKEKTSALYKKLYWQFAAGRATGKKDLAATLFQQKYGSTLLRKAHELRTTNINRVFHTWFAQLPERDTIEPHLKKLDVMANVRWRLAHLRTAARHLQKKGIDMGTAGTNWKKYLPPHFQKIIFFPELWTQEEKDNWGHQFLMQVMNPDPKPDHAHTL